MYLFVRGLKTIISYTHLPPRNNHSAGDGANDVPMIQEAHVGVGIAGMEGMQVGAILRHAKHQLKPHF